MKTSYNGYPASPDPDLIHVVPFVVNGVPFPGGVREGDVHTVLHYFAEQFDLRVEKLSADLGCWGFAYRQNRNADNLSCHASGTAIDLNAVRHPNGKRRTFTREQVAEIRKILAELDGVVRWGGDFGTVDEMHAEVSASPALVAIVARRLTSPPTPTKDDVMSPAQEAKLDRVIDLLERLVAPRRPDHKDTVPGEISLGDVLNKIEEKA